MSAAPTAARAAPAPGKRGLVITWRLTQWLLLLAMGAGISGAYVFFLSAGKMNGFPDWPTYNTNYDMQAEGFRSGHLYLSLAPAPELLAANDPFDPVNSNFWARDLTLYRGHYYLYWGPLPALLLVAVKAGLRIKNVVGDQYLCFAFYLLLLLAGLVLIQRLARQLRPRAPFALTAFGFLAYAFANPTPYLQATAGIYQTAIVAAQAFLVAGLASAFEAIVPATGAGRWRRAAALAGAGLCWAMAIACRVSVGPAVLVLALATLAVGWWRSGTADWAARARDAAWLMVPIGAGVAGLLIYNKVRFDAWLEFGQRYQLNDPSFRFRMSAAYIWPNVYSYLFRPLARSCHFPFASTIADLRLHAFPRGFVVPDGYLLAEPVAGIILTAPWSWLAPVGWWAGLRALLRARRAPALVDQPGDPAQRGLMWGALCFATLAVVTALPWLAAFGCTMRYLADISSGLALSGMLGAWWLTDRARERHRALLILVVAALVVLALWTVVMGGLLGFTGYIEHFRRYNPQLLDRLDSALSVCRS